jgi:hypothetical protein
MTPDVGCGVCKCSPSVRLPTGDTLITAGEMSQQSIPKFAASDIHSGVISENPVHAHIICI